MTVKPDRRPRHVVSERKIDFITKQFTQREACTITGATKMNLDNWIARDILKIGGRNQTGRRLYSMFDLVQLAITSELTTICEVPVNTAAGIMDYAMRRFYELLDRDPSGALIHGPKVPPKMLLFWHENSMGKTVICDGWAQAKKQAPAHPYVVVPLDKIFVRVINRALDVIEQDEAKTLGDVLGEALKGNLKRKGAGDD